MQHLSDDFVSHENKPFQWQMGRLIASSLSGFIAGIIVSTFFWIAVYRIYFSA